MKTGRDRPTRPVPIVISSKIVFLTRRWHQPLVSSMCSGGGGGGSWLMGCPVVSELSTGNLRRHSMRPSRLASSRTRRIW